MQPGGKPAGGGASGPGLAWVLLLAGLLLAYVGARAALLDITHDEAVTANTFVLGNNSVFDLNSPNNQLLNTLAMKASLHLLGDREFFLRLANLLAHAAYLLAGLMILRPLGGAWLVAGGLILLNLNPYLLDFFSLARGYGLGWGLMLLSLWAWSRHLARPGDTRTLHLALGAGLLAITANLTLLNFYLSLVALYLGLSLARAWRQAPGVGPALKTWLAANRLVLANLALAGLVAGPMLAVMWSGGQFYHGGQEGFWADTVGSLIEYSTYDRQYGPWLDPALKGLVGAWTLAAALLVARRAWRGELAQVGMLASVLAILLLCVLANQLQHHLFGARFLTTRTALFLYPLFALLAVLACAELRAWGTAPARWAGRLALAGACLALIWHGAHTLNLTHTKKWPFDASTRAMLADLQALANQRPDQGRPLSLGITWMLEPGISYYRATRHLTWLAPVTRQGVKGDYDFYYYMVHDHDIVKLKPRVKLLRQYPVSYNLLARNLDR